MKILKLQPKIDIPTRSNYHINYNVWDEIQGDTVFMYNFNVNPNNYDVIFLPMYKRIVNNDILKLVKNSKAKTVLFDNDSSYRSFNDPFYNGIDFIFYRDTDQNNKTPNTKSEMLRWSVDTEKYKAKYGGNGISFNCSVSGAYPYRVQIKEKNILKHTNYTGEEYIEHIQNSGGGVHASYPKHTHAKILEFAACGTQIISSRSEHISYYFPDELIIYFDNIEELKNIVKNFEPNIEIQKTLRDITVKKHDSKVRDKQVLNKIEEIL